MVRSPLIPSSPPKKATKITDEAATNSAIPIEIMAKTVPARRVEKLPMMMAMSKPNSPPTRGNRGMGSGSKPSSTKFMM